MDQNSFATARLVVACNVCIKCLELLTVVFTNLVGIINYLVQLQNIKSK